MDAPEKRALSASSFRWCVIAGALAAAVSVALGAFGAHALRTAISSEMLAAYETAVRYQIYHASGIILAGIAGLHGGSPHPKRLLASGMLFAAGIILFSGSLYAMSLSGIKAFGALTPFGGMAFLAGWVTFAGAYFRRK